MSQRSSSKQFLSIGKKWNYCEIGSDISVKKLWLQLVILNLLAIFIANIIIPTFIVIKRNINAALDHPIAGHVSTAFQAKNKLLYFISENEIK